MSDVHPDLICAQELFANLQVAVSERIVGMSKEITLILAGMLSGHVLLEGKPGLAKTVLARTIADACTMNFRRVQMTPDLLPAEVTGSDIWNPQTQEFVFIFGPVNCNILLADEVNRATPKTNSALLEVMEEQQVTTSTGTHKVPNPFIVLATQNPQEYEGTYALPETARDRFVMKVIFKYPEHEDAIKIMGVMQQGVFTIAVKQVMDCDQFIAARKAIREHVHIEEALQHNIAYIVEMTRPGESNEIVLPNGSIKFGAGTRAQGHLIMAAQAFAALKGRNFVTPEDIRELTYSVLAHRIVFADRVDPANYEKELRDILKSIFQHVFESEQFNE